MRYAHESNEYGLLCPFRHRSIGRDAFRIRFRWPREVSNAFAYLLSTLADVESVLSENVEISNSILSVEGAKGGFRAAKADYRLSDNAKNR